MSAALATSAWKRWERSSFKGGNPHENERRFYP
jgi:hypothetical protein